MSCEGATKKLLKQIASEYNIHIEEATVVFPVHTDDEVCVGVNFNSQHTFPSDCQHC